MKCTDIRESDETVCYLFIMIVHVCDNSVSWGV